MPHTPRSSADREHDAVERAAFASLSRAERREILTSGPRRHPTGRIHGELPWIRAARLACGDQVLIPLHGRLVRAEVETIWESAGRRSVRFVYFVGARRETFTAENLGGADWFAVYSLS